MQLTTRDPIEPGGGAIFVCKEWLYSDVRLAFSNPKNDLSLPKKDTCGEFTVKVFEVAIHRVPYHRVISDPLEDPFQKTKALKGFINCRKRKIHGINNARSSRPRRSLGR